MSCGVLNARLLSAAGFVRQGAVFADVGTDHAYLPIFLLERGRILRAVCSDINEGPLASAVSNVSDAALSDRCEFVLCNGAASLSDNGITDYAICGMGGELIAEIINSAPHLRDEGINLILQPMTKVAVLRKYLYENGFEILAEAYSLEGDKRYVCINARYSGKIREISDSEAEIGLAGTKVINDSVRMEYLTSKRRSLQRALEGKLKGAESVEYEREVISLIDEILNEGRAL